MFQPRAKLEFVRRYCAPPRFSVCIDIDASEEGRTGGSREKERTQRRQLEMQDDALAVRLELAQMNVTTKYRPWRQREAFADLSDGGYWRGPDIIACDSVKKLCVIVEVEADSSGQPEQKLYKAVGQIVRAISEAEDKWQKAFVIAVWGNAMADHLRRLTVLEKLGVTAVALGGTKADDDLIFGSLAF